MNIESLPSLTIIALDAFALLKERGFLSETETTVDPDLVYDAVSDILDNSPFNGNDEAFDIAEAMVVGMIDHHYR